MISLKEFLKSKSTYIVLAIVAMNVAVWISWEAFKPRPTQRIASVERVDTKPDSLMKGSWKEKSAKRTAEIESLKKEVDSLKAANAAPSTAQSTLQFILDNWTAFFTILSTIPVVVLKWEQTLHKIKKINKRKPRGESSKH